MAFSGRYSARVERLGGDASGIWAVHERASALRAAGEEIYLLSVGDPDLSTLPSTIDHAIESLREGRTHYAPGVGERHLHEAICRGSARRTARIGFAWRGLRKLDTRLRPSFPRATASVPRGVDGSNRTIRQSSQCRCD
jgi:hypothetical protein